MTFCLSLVLIALDISCERDRLGRLTEPACGEWCYNDYYDYICNCFVFLPQHRQWARKSEMSQIASDSARNDDPAFNNGQCAIKSVAAAAVSDPETDLSREKTEAVADNDITAGFHANFYNRKTTTTCHHSA
jgi:hypothetical protein